MESSDRERPLVLRSLGVKSHKRKYHAVKHDVARESKQCQALCVEMLQTLS